MALATWLEEFQTLTVGVVGFAGVILTLWFNARQAREQRREERRHECQTLRTALIEELRINREWLVRNTEKVIKDTINDLTEERGYFAPTDPMDDAYRAFRHRIGFLSQPEVGKVMYAYLSLRTYNAQLFLIGVPPHTGDRHVQVPAKNAQLLSEMQKSLIGPIEEALTVLEHARDRG
jgi:hypothetical protein